MNMVSCTQMRASDKLATEQTDISQIVLIENVTL